MQPNRPNNATLRDLASRPNFVRNICILAHVDHGKTTIADSLVATNGHISKRIAGNARYLDDRKDEQERGITMKSSVISLSYIANDTKENMVINLIDTPGHIDFSTEVSAAIRICDGALIVVDVIEGVCVQTREAIKQAFEERIKMILMVNKIDRIIVEQQKSVDIIFQHILRVLEDCNAYIAELCKYDMQSNVNEEDYLFSPDSGNVIFGSAIDGWGVTTLQISEMFADMFENESVESLNGKLWNFDYYISKGKIVMGAIDKKKPNIFMSLFLTTINYIYFTLRIRLDRSKYGVIVSKLKISRETSEMKHTDAKIQAKAILQAWRPLAATILHQVKMIIPPPTNVSKDRFEYLINSKQYYGNKEMEGYANKLTEHLADCTNPDSPTIVYISKMFPVSTKMLTQQKSINIVVGRKDREEVIRAARQVVDDSINGITRMDTESSNQDEVVKENNSSDSEDEDKVTDYGVIALARVFSGTLKVGQYMYVLNSSYKPPVVIADNINIDDYVEHSTLINKVKIKELFILLGRELTSVDSVASGNICGIRGLDKLVARTGTLSSTPFILPLTERISLEPIVRNSIECDDHKDMPVLRKALKFLKIIDSCVQVAVQESGELVLVTAGDVHLAKCIEDIRTMIADIKINVSKPMVALKETVLSSNRRIDISQQSPFAVNLNITEMDMKLCVIVVPLPDEIVEFVHKNYELMKIIEEYEHTSGADLMMHHDNQENLSVSKEKEYNATIMSRLKDQMKTVFTTCKGPWGEMWKNIWSIGKKHDHINLLFNNTKLYQRSMFSTVDETDARSCLDHTILSGFDMCCRAGPICEEPLSNCAFIVNDYQLNNYGALKDNEVRAQIFANIPLLVRDSFREAFQKQLPRLMEPIFITDIQVNTRILGKVYSVVSRRHGNVLDAVGMDEDEKSFLVKAQIPVAESYDFANEIRKTTSGQANPSLRFSHYEIIDGDPYYNMDEVESEDEDEESKNSNSKRASDLRREVRTRKGLKIDDQVVVHAEKQRTRNKKK